MLRYDAQQNNVHYHSQYTCQIWFRSGLVKASYGSTHARSDSEVVWLRPVMAIMASMQPESGQIVYAVRFWPGITGPGYGQHFWADPDGMKTTSGMSTGILLLNTDTLLHFYLTHQPSARWVHGWWTTLPLALLCWKKSILDSMSGTSCMARL